MTAAGKATASPGATDWKQDVRKGCRWFHGGFRSAAQQLKPSESKKLHIFVFKEAVLEVVMVQWLTLQSTSGGCTVQFAECAIF